MIFIFYGGNLSSAFHMQVKITELTLVGQVTAFSTARIASKSELGLYWLA